MKNVSKLLTFIFLTSFLAQCQQAVVMSKEEISAELKTKLSNDTDFKKFIVEKSDYFNKSEINYFNESEKTEAYIQANGQRINSGQKKAVYEEAGLKHVDEFIKYQTDHSNYFTMLRNRYKAYQEKLGKNEYYNVFVDIENEIVPYKSPNKD